MQKLMILIIILACAFVSPAIAGDTPVPDIDMVRKILLQPDFDYTIFIGEDLCTSLIYLIENDDTEIRDRVVRRALCALPDTGDERAVEYLIEYIDDHPLDCLYGLGDFPTPESCDALMAHLDDDDEFNRRYAAQSLGNLDFTVSDEMWELRDECVALLNERLELEEEEWILPIIEDGIKAVEGQVREEGSLSLGD
jgi:hypothetical protein